MELFGTTRSRLQRSHAVFTPESFVRSDLPGWERSQGVILISPRIGARFVQYLALMETGRPRRQRRRPASSACCTCSKGESRSRLPGRECVLEAGGFAYCPPDAAAAVEALGSTPPEYFREKVLRHGRDARARADRRQRERGRRHTVSRRSRRGAQGAVCRSIRDSISRSTCSRSSPARLCRWSRCT